MRFDLIDLRLFLCVAEASSITHGAARANMTLASASERIRGMEMALGARLLERQRRGVRLTSVGSALAFHARIVTQQLEQMRGELNEYSKGLRAHIRLLGNTVAIGELLPNPVVAFLSANPNVDLELEDRPSREIVRLVAEGIADIGVVTEAVDPADELETYPIGKIRLVVVGPREHPLRQQRKITFREILDYNFIGPPLGSALQEFLDHNAARFGRRLNVRVRLSGFDPICRLAESGIGLAVLPETAARRFQRSMAIEIYPLTDTWALRHHAICVRNLRSLPVHARRLVECLNPGLH